MQRMHYISVKLQVSLQEQGGFKTKTWLLDRIFESIRKKKKRKGKEFECTVSYPYKIFLKLYHEPQLIAEMWSIICLQVYSSMSYWDLLTALYTIPVSIYIKFPKIALRKLAKLKQSFWQKTVGKTALCDGMSGTCQKLKAGLICRAELLDKDQLWNEPLLAC